MATTQATARKVGRYQGRIAHIDDVTQSEIKSETYYDRESLALQMTEDFGRSRKYWLCALSTGEDA